MYNEQIDPVIVSQLETLELRPGCSEKDLRANYFRLKQVFSEGSDAMYGLMDDDTQKEQLGKIEEAYNGLLAYFAGIAPGARQGAATATLPRTQPQRRPEGQLRKAEELLEETREVRGSIFAELREMLNVSLEEIQEKTKVSTDKIKAMEADDLAGLPETVFVRGYVTSYLRALSVGVPAHTVPNYLKWVKSCRNEE